MLGPWYNFREQIGQALQFLIGFKPVNPVIHSLFDNSFIEAFTKVDTNCYLQKSTKASSLEFIHGHPSISDSIEKYMRFIQNNR